MQNIWKTIQSNRDLDLPSLKVMASFYRCEEIAEEGLENFEKDETWLQLERDVQSTYIANFGNKLNMLLHICLSRYDVETLCHAQDAASKKRQLLLSKLLELVRPAYLSMMSHILTKALNNFQKSFAESIKDGNNFDDSTLSCKTRSRAACNDECEDAAIDGSGWTSSELLDSLEKGMDEHVHSIRDSKLFDLMLSHEMKLRTELSESLTRILLQDSNDRKNAWVSVRGLLSHVIECNQASISKDLSDLSIGRNTNDETCASIYDQAVASIEIYSKNWVRTFTKKIAKEVRTEMKNRFREKMLLDESKKDRVWNAQQDIEAIKEKARSDCLDFLSIFAAVQLDKHVDDIARTLRTALLRKHPNTVALYRTTWESVTVEDTICKPARCRSLWVNFEKDVEDIVDTATARRNSAIKVAKAKEKLERTQRRMSRCGGGCSVM